MERLETLLAYDDGVLPARMVLRDELPEVDHVLVSKLHRAARDGKETLVEVILSSEQQMVDEVDAARQTALHYACGSKEKSALEVVKVLVHNGANINAKDFMGSTPLHNAVRANRLDIVQFLINETSSNVLNLNSNDCHMRTPMHIAVYMEWVDILKLLLNHGANYSLLDSDNMTPMLIAKSKNHVQMIELILRRMKKFRSAAVLDDE